ncbi:hypothetical protein QUF90_21840 [Desulfococcaceae bacterium HSG9]|nr:hypothetical protein [Desulfococcaceae bacterium HSG9]
MKKMCYVCCVVSMLVSFTSCAKSPGPYLLQTQPLQSPMQHSERLIALDKSAANALLYVNHNQGRLASGQVAIQINLQNRSAQHAVWIEWKTVFYDKQNFKIEETEWEMTHFPAKEIKTLKINSISPDVMNFSIILRSPATVDGQPYKIQKEGVR